MSRLGYPRFGAQGGNIGAGVTERLGAILPDRLIGTHVNSDSGALGMVGVQLPMPDDLDADQTAVVTAAQAPVGPGTRVSGRSEHPTGDDRRCPDRLAGWAAGMDCGEMPELDQPLRAGTRRCRRP